jgi:two-component system sensor kinase FixL
MPFAALTPAMLLVFVIDLFVPWPIGVTVFYLPLLLLAASVADRKIMWICFASFVLLTLAPVFVATQSPNRPDISPLLLNRFGVVAAGLAICCFAASFMPLLAVARRSLASTVIDEREFRDLAENLPDVVARFDRQLRHVYVNRAVQRYTGKAPEVFLGKDHTELDMPPELVGLWQAKIREVFDTGKAQSFEYTYVAQQGPRHFECRLVPERVADGSVETVLGINRDLTETIRAQEQAQSHLEQLAHAGRLSTIGSLVSEISHEINQPLHAIANYARAGLNVLERTPDNSRPNLAIWLKQIADQAKRAAEIIRRSSRFARKKSARRSTVDINELIRDCLRLENFDLRAHRIKLRCELADGLPSLVADSIQIQQVLVNLIRNAIEAMNDNAEVDRRLLVRSESVDGCVQISIKDNGMGMGAEQTEKLFEPFFTTKEEGMGMGLAVSQAIVEAHSGKLWAEPNPDRGVTFYLTLPVGREEPNHEYARV